MQSNSVVKLPEPINRIVASVGRIVYNDEPYIPCLPKDMIDTQGNFVPVPETVVLSNLRATVEALANPRTPANIRHNFRSKNPIPGTKWSEDNFLLNPDDIIVPNYTVAHFRDDTFQITPFVNQLETYIPKLKGGINKVLEDQGHKSQFVCNLSGLLKQPELGDGAREQELQILYKRLPIGEIHLFWSRYKLDASDKILGVITLLGEVPSLRKVVDPLYTLRQSQCTYHSHISFSGAITLCFGL